MQASGSFTAPRSAADHRFRLGHLGDVSPEVARRIAAASGDVALVVSGEGVILDIAVNSEDLEHDNILPAWLGQPWADTVALDSRQKVDSMLSEARRDGQSQWRELSQSTSNNDSIIIRYTAVDLERGGVVLAIGRDDRATYNMQQRLLEAQQLIDRDYLRLRDAESLSLVLFRTSSESILIVDLATRKVVDANPEAERLLGEEKADLVGAAFSRLFDENSQEEALSLLVVAHTVTADGPSEMQLLSKGRSLTAGASLFRQGRAARCLVRLTPTLDARSRASDIERRAFEVLEHLPEAWIVTDDSLKIKAVNVAFLDLARIATREHALGQGLNRFLGRADLDRTLLVDNLREHGSVRNFATMFRNQYAGLEDVEVSAVSVESEGEPYLGFLIRRLQRRPSEPTLPTGDHRRSVEQLSALVGRVKLKDLVRESTDLVEKLCIEAALELSRNNRASAADLLGLSRQSLYSKLHRFGIANQSDEETKN